MQINAEGGSRFCSTPSNVLAHQIVIQHKVWSAAHFAGKVQNLNEIFMWTGMRFFVPGNNRQIPKRQNFGLMSANWVKIQ
jgi:hypothetical protein